VARRFGDVVAVDGISLHVPAGTLLALLGPNGARNTTTVRMLAGMVELGNWFSLSFDALG
jgi:ABC-type multidrug transport system ATPase subunit